MEKKMEVEQHACDTSDCGITSAVRFDLVPMFALARSTMAAHKTDDDDDDDDHDDDDDAKHEPCRD